MTINDSPAARPSAAMTNADVANGESRSALEPSRDDAAGRCVLIAVDESPEAVDTARAAVRLMGPLAHYVLVNVGTTTLPWVADTEMWGAVPPAMVVLAPSIGVEPRVRDGLTQSAEETAEAAASAVANSAGLGNAETVGATGRDKSDAICAVAHEHGADVIVVGHRHRSWLDRLLSRSVTNDLLRDANCPVLVVP
jgi:nucleotide-binding universal stress UspA family protein